MNEGSNDPLITPGAAPAGVVVPWACPECSGTLWEATVGSGSQLRCRVGHAYSPKSFLSEQSATIERTLWAAIRLLEERAAALRHLAKDDAITTETRERFLSEAAESERRARDVRKVIET